MADSIDYARIAKNIRQLRELKGLTREQFCNELHYDTNYWGSIERGERAINLQKIVEVSNYFGVSIDELVGVENSDKASKEQLSKLTQQLKNCSSIQVAAVQKVVEDIVPYIK